MSIQRGTLNLTREQAIAEHRKMWNWIADETEKQKRCISKAEYFDHFADDYEKTPLYHCFCCDYTHLERIYCDSCIIQWGIGIHTDEILLCSKSEFGEWRTAKNRQDWQEAARLAREIANLPERKV